MINLRVQLIKMWDSHSGWAQDIGGLSFYYDNASKKLHNWFSLQQV